MSNTRLQNSPASISDRATADVVLPPLRAKYFRMADAENAGPESRSATVDGKVSSRSRQLATADRETPRDSGNLTNTNQLTVEHACSPPSLG